MGNMTELAAKAMREVDPLGRGNRGLWTAYVTMAEAAISVAYNPNRNEMTQEQAESILKRSL